MASVSKQVGEQNPEVAASEVFGSDVSREIGADGSGRGIAHNGMSKAQYYLTLIISAAIAMIAMICIIAVMEGIESGRPPVDD